MKRLVWFMGVFLLVLAWSGPGRANLVNGGFETGDITGWNYDPTPPIPGTLPGIVLEGGNVLWPVEGNWMVGMAQTVVATMTEEGWIYSRYGGWLTQNVSVPAGGKIIGYAALVPASSITDYGDYAYVQVGNDEVWRSHYQQPQDVTWEQWEWTAPAADTYTLQLAEVQNLDSPYGAFAYFDGIQVVPLPSSLLLLGSGLAALGVRRRQKA